MARRTSTTSSGVTLGRTTSRTQVSTINAPTGSRSQTSATSGSTMVYPVSDYCGMNILVRDPIYVNATTSSIIINVSSSNTTTPQSSDCPQVRSIVGDTVTLVGREESYIFTFGTTSTDVAATARLTPTAKSAIGYVGLTDKPDHNTKVSLIDTGGNKVVYNFDTSSAHYDGRVNGSDEVIVGLSGIRTDGEDAADDATARLLAAINATTEYSNSLTLNITAALVSTLTGSSPTIGNSPMRSNFIKLTQDVPGASGNTSIITPTTNIGSTSGRISGVPFTGGSGLNPKDMHGTTLTFKDVAGTVYAATCSLGDSASTSFTFNATSVSGSTILLESTRGAKISYKAVGDCDELATGEAERINLSSASSVVTIYYTQGTSSAESARELTKAIQAGHGGNISASYSNSTVTLTQRVGGTAGNTTITTGGNFTNSITGGSVSNFANGSNLTYSQSTARKIGLGSITTANHLAHAIQDSIDQARQFGVLSSGRASASGTLLDITAFSAALGANGYVDITQDVAGTAGNVDVDGTMIKQGHVVTAGFTGGANSVNATVSPQSTTTLATTLAAAINSKASDSFSASVIDSVTNSSGDTIARVQVGLKTYGPGDNLSYITSSHSGTVTFSNVSGSTGMILRTRANFSGGSSEEYDQNINMLSGGAAGDYDLQNPSDTPYINTKASEIFGFNPHPMKNDADYFNNLLLNRNGPYGWPTWKQIKGYSNIQANDRGGRKNLYTLELKRREKRFNAYDTHVWAMNPSSPPAFPGEFDHKALLGPDAVEELLLDPSYKLPPFGLTPPTKPKRQNSPTFYEPAVVIRHNPFEYMVDDVPSIVGEAETALVRSTLFNGLHFFTNPEMNQYYEINDADTIQKFGKGVSGRNKELYNFFYAGINEIKGYNFSFREQIFPREISTFRNITRYKPKYEESMGWHENGMHRRLSLIRSFWRTDKCDRIRPIHGTRTEQFPPYSSIGYPWNNSWSSTGDGVEMSHGEYSKPDWSAITEVVAGTDSNIQAGQPWYGPGIAIWYYNEVLDPNKNGYPEEWGGLFKHVYGVGFTTLSCSIIVKSSHESDLTGPDTDGDGKPNFIDPTPSATTPGYSFMDYLGLGNTVPNDDEGNPMPNMTAQDWYISQKMDHQPYDFSLLSMWPLDFPAHIAVPHHIKKKMGIFNQNTIEDVAATIWRPYGGQYSLGHVCLGLAPNRLGTPYLCDGRTFDTDKWNEKPTVWGFGIGQDDWPTSVEWFEKAGQTVEKPHYVQDAQTGEWVELPPEKGIKKITYGPSHRTGAAGELIYSTKPTITLYKRKLPDLVSPDGLWHSILNPAPNGTSPDTDLYMWTSNPFQTYGKSHADRMWRSDTTLGYESSTASFQFLRHAWPYFQPLWRLDELSERTPMHNSYADFVSDITPMSRDYSILPEFRLSNNQLAYDEILGEAAQKRYPIYVLSEDGRIRRNLFQPIKHVANFLNVDGGYGKTEVVSENLSEIGEPYLEHHTQSAKTDSLPATEDVYYYEPLTQHAGRPYKKENKEESWRGDPVSVEFYERYSHTETGENFSKLMRQEEKGFKKDKDTSPAKIRLSFRGIKKLLPFKDFYPVNRTITMGAQLVNVFTSSMDYDPKVYSASLLYTSSIAGVGVVTGGYPNESAIAAAATQSFIEPLFAPGIMFNSIKSGIAVSYPIYIDKNNPRYFGNSNMNSQFGPNAESATASSTTAYQYDEDWNTDVFPPDNKLDKWQYSHDPKEFLGYGYGSMMGVASAMPTFLMNKFNHQLPFEAIYDLGQLNVMSKFKTYMVDDFVDLDRTEQVEGDFEKDPHSWTTTTGSIVVKINSLGTDQAGAVASEYITILGSAGFPSDTMITLTASLDTAVEATSSAVYTVASPNNTLVITYPRGQSENERNVKIAEAINLHCTASADWNPATFQPYFVSSSTRNTLNKQILTASHYYAKDADGTQNAYVKIRSAHSLALEQQRMINYRIVSTNHPPQTSSLEPLSSSGPYGNTVTSIYLYQGFFSGSAHRQVTQHEFKPHVVLDSVPKLQDSPDRRIYESSINNFLAETINFFIEKDSTMVGRYYDLRMPVAVSKPKQDIKVKSGVEYYMTVNLYMGDNHVMCEGPRFADVPFIRDNASASMRGAFFGPPMEVVHRSSGSLDGPSGSALTPLEETQVMVSPLSGTEISQNTGYTTELQGLIDNITDPAYHHVTPPYFYGPSSIVLKYTATSNQTTLEEVFQTAKAQSLYVEEYTTGLAADDLAGYTTNRFPTSSLCPKIPTAESVSTGSAARMKIEASLNIFGKPGNSTNQVIPVSPLKSAHSSAKEASVWVMLPKWVCPVLDFGLPTTMVRNVERYSPNNAKVPEVKFKNTTPYYDVLSGRSMWMGYGFDPYDQADKKIMEMHLKKMELIYGSAQMQLDNLEELEQNGLASVVTDPSQGSEAVHKKGIWFQLSEEFPEKFQGEIGDSITFATDTSTTNQFTGANTKSGYVTKRSDVFSSEKTGSLMQLLGFDEATGNSPIPIGKIAKQKTISEAVVAIPYFEEPWWIDGKQAMHQMSGADSSVVGYQLDSVTNEARQDGYVLRSIAGTLKSAIIPGKYFLKVDTILFQNILNLLLVDHLTSPKTEDNDALRGVFEDYENSLGAARRTDMGRTLKTLLGVDSPAPLGYMLPPEFDFVNNASVPAFQMVVAPFSHSLDRYDLMNIWQNLMPDASLRAEKVKTDVIIRPGEAAFGEASFNDLLGKDIQVQGMRHSNPGQYLSTKALRQGIQAENQEVWQYGGNVPKSSAEFFKKLRWMVFKVKQRAAHDYEQYTRRQVELALNKQDMRMHGTYSPLDSLATTEIYGSNWPYDYFSLIEKAKIDIEYEVTG